MKTMNLVGLGLLLTFLLACKKDEDVSDCAKLEGDWQCESWIEDGQEFLGTTEVITSSEINFKVLTGDQGDYEWNISYLIGGSEMIIGAYVVNQDCDQVTITPKGGGAPAVYNFHIEGDLLILEGTINAVVTELQFRKE